MQAGSIAFQFLINFGYRNKPELYTQNKASWTINQDLKKNLHCRFFLSGVFNTCKLEVSRSAS